VFSLLNEFVLGSVGHRVAQVCVLEMFTASTGEANTGTRASVMQTRNHRIVRNVVQPHVHHPSGEQVHGERLVAQSHVPSLYLCLSLSLSLCLSLCFSESLCLSFSVAVSLSRLVRIFHVPCLSLSVCLSLSGGQ